MFLLINNKTQVIEYMSLIADKIQNMHSTLSKECSIYHLPTETIHVYTIPNALLSQMKSYTGGQYIIPKTGAK